VIVFAASSQPNAPFFAKIPSATDTSIPPAAVTSRLSDGESGTPFGAKDPMNLRQVSESIARFPTGKPSPLTVNVVESNKPDLSTILYLLFDKLFH